MGKIRSIPSIAIAIAMFALTTASAAIAAESAYIAGKTGNIVVGCACVLAVSGCQSNLIDSVAGKQRQTWTQDAAVLAGQSYDLNEACYRKRNISGFGGGLCCEIPGDEQETVRKLFRGTGQP